MNNWLVLLIGPPLDDWLPEGVKQLDFNGSLDRWHQRLDEQAAEKRICHGHELRKGDPLSLMLFILVMECFNATFTFAESRGLLQPLGCPAIKNMFSLYMDDVTAFVSSVAQDLMLVRGILDTFHETTGLAANYAKCQAFLVRCSSKHTNLIRDTLSCSVA